MSRTSLPKPQFLVAGPAPDGDPSRCGATPGNRRSRIPHNPDPCGGSPCIRGMRIRVRDILALKAASSMQPAQCRRPKPRAAPGRFP
ncbi:MAG: DUF433 domain-containing protein [Synechococcaceae cyanobacterium]